MEAPRAVVVCSILPLPARSGGQLRTLRVLEAAERAGAHPHLISTDSVDPEGTELLRERGWSIDPFAQARVPARMRARRHLGGRIAGEHPQVRRLVGRLAPESALVQAEHTANASYLDAVGDAPAVFSTHNVDSAMTRSLAGLQGSSLARARLRARALSFARAERRAARLADVVVAVSDHDADHYRTHAGGRVLVAPNGVDEGLLSLSPLPSSPETVLFVGLLSYAPNTAGLLRFLASGWPELAVRRPRARLRIVGDGAGPELRAAVAAAERAELAGLVPDIAAELEQASVVAVPVWQGAGTRLKVLEALAAARPVVGTPLGVEGVGFRAGEHGLISASARELGELGAKLLGDESLRRRLGEAGRTLAAAHAWPLALAPLEAIYRGYVRRARPLRS